VDNLETLLDCVENPCLSKDVGAPGSLVRRANDLGRELAKLRRDFEKGYEQGVIEVLSEVKVADSELYRRLCTIFNPVRP